MTAMTHQAALSTASFNYLDCIIVLASVTSDGRHITLALCIFFQRIDGLMLFNGDSQNTVGDVMACGWKFYWNCDVVVVSTCIYAHWLTRFLPAARRNIHKQKWTAVFRDGYRAQTNVKVMNMLYFNCVAVTAWLAHWNDRFQPLTLAYLDPIRTTSKLKYKI